MKSCKSNSSQGFFSFSSLSRIWPQILQVMVFGKRMGRNSYSPLTWNGTWLKLLTFLCLIWIEGLGQVRGTKTSLKVWESEDGRLQILDEESAVREPRRSIVSGGAFTIVSFENVPCNASTGDIGVCYSARECMGFAGTAAGPCAGSFGVCCVLTVQCGDTVTINNTYFVNPGFPSTIVGPLSCSITVNKMANAVSLYLEFISFNILGPSECGCTNDSFTVTLQGASSSTFPVLCGVNDGQMEYISFGSSPGPVTLTFTLSASPAQRLWKIRLVQLKARDACLAPGGCTQFFRELSGTITSFNYNGGQGQLLSSYCINICFQTHPGYCNLLLTENNFMLPGFAPSDCGADYLLINGQKFCGDTLNNGMVQVNQTTPGSFISITFCAGACHPDLDVGYSLSYAFLPCSVQG